MINEYKKLIIITLLVITGITGISCLFLSGESRAVKNETPKTETIKKVSKKTPGAEELETLLNNGKPTVFYFTSQYCRDCIQVKPIIEKLKKKHGEKVDFIVVDVRGKDSLSKAALKKYKVLGVPLTIFVKIDGSKQKSLAGFYPESNFERQIQLLIED